MQELESFAQAWWVFSLVTVILATILWVTDQYERRTYRVHGDISLAWTHDFGVVFIAGIWGYVFLIMTLVSGITKILIYP